MNRQLYFVVGDSGLNASNGIFVQRLEDIKPRLIRHRIRGEWTLVLSIHGSQEFIANQVRAIRGGQGSCDADAVRRIFGQDQAFVRWRDEHGPRSQYTFGKSHYSIPHKEWIRTSCAGPGSWPPSKHFRADL